MALVSDLGVCKESVDLRMFAPGCTAQIAAVVKLGNDAIPELKGGIQSENLLLVANCARSLLLMEAPLTEIDLQALVDRRRSIKAMIPGGVEFTEIEKRGERFFGEHRFAVRSIDELIKKTQAGQKGEPQNQITR